ncbi:Uncharacterized protein M6_Spy0233 [Geodia barretti]|uniref:Uncharacterized protein M6_Spy0233 n=1 Tax=Geodia barretti TaxID=519541 RepID=A0AA35RRW4_GEOBA|nr:Uncharacterized protein M6_Spy0233 [Geodia barretti]
MFRASDNVDIDVTTRSRSSGGIMSGIKRMIAGEHFLLLAVHRFRLSRRRGRVGAQVAGAGGPHRVRRQCTLGLRRRQLPRLRPRVTSTRSFQGLRGMLSGESLSFLTVEGVGPLLVNAFGTITELEVKGGLTIDTGHVVAFEDSLEYSVGKAGGSWVSSFLTSEGLVLHFSGYGRVYVQSHNPDEFGRTLGPLLPEKS